MLKRSNDAALTARLCVTWKLPYQRRKYPASRPTRGVSWCCTDVENSQLYARVPQPNRVSWLNCATDVGSPKFRLDTVPHSPFNCRLSRLQSGMKLPLLSVQLRVTVLVMPAGLP